MGGHGEMQYASPLVRQHQEGIYDLEPDRGNG
jgi:hypothetical protein